MRIELVQVRKEEKEVLRNLLEKYDYEFSQYDLRDVNALGLYGYDWLDCYWTEERRWPFFIKVDGPVSYTHLDVYKRQARVCVFRSMYCVPDPEPRAFAKRLVRLQKIAREAEGQSLRGRVPEVTGLFSYQEMLRQAAASDTALFFYERGGKSIKNIPVSYTHLPHYSRPARCDGYARLRP